MACHCFVCRAIFFPIQQWLFFVAITAAITVVFVCLLRELTARENGIRVDLCLESITTEQTKLIVALFLSVSNNTGEELAKRTLFIYPAGKP